MFAVSYGFREGVSVGTFVLLMLGWVVPEHRRYRFAGEGEVGDGDRYEANIDSGLLQDFGPTFLVPVEDDGDGDVGEHLR